MGEVKRKEREDNAETLRFAEEERGIDIIQEQSEVKTNWR
jgi:hypothetical protein